MKQLLTDKDRDMLGERIAEAEKLTGSQIVLATVKRCDNYAEIPWKAFALGSTLAGFIVFLLNFFVFGWITNTLIFFSISVIIATGILFAILTILIQGFARLFLLDSRKETETMQYAESFFLSHELFATEGRKGILLLVSQFERQVIIIPDKGVKEFLTSDVLKNTISKMAHFLKKNEVRKAFEIGLDEIISVLKQSEIEKQVKNELSNEIIEEEGV